MESKNLLQLTGGTKKSKKGMKRMTLAMAVLCSVGYLAYANQNEDNGIMSVIKFSS